MLPARWLPQARRRALTVVALCLAMLGLVPLGVVPAPSQAQSEPVGAGASGDYISVEATLGSSAPPGGYHAGDRLAYRFVVHNLTDEALTVVPRATELENFSHDTRPNEYYPADLPACSIAELAAGAGCQYADTFHTVTEADLSAGSFAPETTWTVSDAGDGALLTELAVTGPRVDLPRASTTFIDRTGWEASATSWWAPQDETSTMAPASASNAIDGDPSTFWMSREVRPHRLTIHMGTTHRVGGLRYTSRAVNGYGNIKDYDIEVSSDGNSWQKVDSGTFQRGPSTTLATFEPTRARHVRLTGKTAQWGGLLAAAAEIDLLAAPSEPSADPTHDLDLDVERSLDSSYVEHGIAQDGASSEGGTHHGPALTVASSGDLLAAYEQRPAEGRSAVLQRRSSDNGATWGDPTLVRSDPQGAAGYSDPSYVVDRESGTIFLFHTVSTDDGTAPGALRSDDDGASWTSMDLDTSWSGHSVSSGQGIQLQYGAHAGRLVQQLVVRQGEHTVGAQSLYSEDHGATWRLGEPVGLGMAENTSVELSDGEVMLSSGDSARSGYRRAALSQDGGHTYGEVRLEPQLTGRLSTASLIRAFPGAGSGSAGAEVLLFSGAGADHSSGVVRLSCDDGESWPVAKHFQPGAMSASTLATQPDGTIGMLYESGSGIDYAGFTLAWLDGVCARVDVADVSVQAGTSTTVPVTLTNLSSEDISAGELTLDLPLGWTVDEETVAVPALPSRTGTTATVSFTVAEDAPAGDFPITATLVTPDGQASARFVASVESTVAELIAVAPELVSPSPDGSYVPGDSLRYRYRVTNLGDTTITVSPTGNLVGLDPQDSASNCRHIGLAPGATYACVSAYHHVTATDLDAGTFIPRTTWRVTDQGTEELLGDVRRDGPDTSLAWPEDLIPQSRISIADYSSQNLAWEEQRAEYAIDGKPTTMWHNHWNTSGQQHHITLDLGHNYEVHTLRYLPRQAGASNGVFKDYSVYVSQDGQTWGEPVLDSDVSGAGPDSRLTQVVPLEEKVGRYLKIVVDDSHGNAGPSASVAELNVQGRPIGAEITKRAWDLGGAAVPEDASAIPGAGTEIPGLDSDGEPAPSLDDATAVTWTYEVANVGEVVLTDVTVTDTYTAADGREHEVAVCSQDTLAVGATMTCAWSSILGLDLFAALGTTPAGSRP